MDSYRLKPFPLEVTCENIVSTLLQQSNNKIAVEFDWVAETFPECQRIFQTLQREAIVEFAAVATAFLIVTNLAKRNITEVTLRGDKADYFLDEQKCLLEISGTENAAHLASRSSTVASQSFRKGWLCFRLLFFQSKGKIFI
jgi:hypothetical protein